MKKWLFIITALLLLFLSWQGYVYYQKIMAPQKIVAEDTEEIILNNFPVNEVTKIHRYAGLSKSYQVAEAITDTDELVYIWVSETDDETYKINSADGWNRQDVLNKVSKEENPKEIIRVTPGLEGNEQNRLPIWEVVFIDQEDRYTSYYLDFTDGSYLQSYRLNKET